MVLKKEEVVGRWWSSCVEVSLLLGYSMGFSSGGFGSWLEKCLYWRVRFRCSQWSVECSSDLVLSLSAFVLRYADHLPSCDSVSAQ